MFRRKLRREKNKYRVKILFAGLLILTLIIVAAEFAYVNLSFGKNTFISPIAKESKSKSALLENTLDKNKILFSSVDVASDGSYAVSLKDSGEVILSSKKDIQSQLTSLQLILSRLTIEGKKLKKLDFRFSNPVISL